jgi:hypothetical protein
MGEKKNVYRILVGKPEGKRPLGRPRPPLSKSCIEVKQETQILTKSVGLLCALFGATVKYLS